MSSFIVNDNCLNDVCTLIKRYKPEILENMDDNSFKKCLYQLNLDAYNQRYHEEESDITDLRFKFVESTRHELTMARSMACYIYQCGEGDIFNREIYKTLDNFIHEIYSKFDRKYIMNTETMEHPRKFEDSFKALDLYMKEHKIEQYWGD